VLAVHIRNLHVEPHEVRRLLGNRRDGFLAASGRGKKITLGHEHQFQQLPVVVLVVYYQNARRALQTAEGRVHRETNDGVRVAGDETFA
jgi:hypothetical protein